MAIGIIAPEANSEHESATSMDFPEEVYAVQDSLRIALEIISDTMVNFSLESHKEMLKAQERIIALANYAQTDLEKLRVISSKLREFHHE